MKRTWIVSVLILALLWIAGCTSSQPVSIYKPIIQSLEESQVDEMERQESLVEQPEMAAQELANESEVLSEGADEALALIHPQELRQGESLHPVVEVDNQELDATELESLETDSQSSQESPELAMVEEKEQKPLYDITVVRNKRVDHYINYYTTRLKRSVEIGFKRSEPYYHLLRSILKEEGVPQDLVYLVFIESNFRSNALSHAHALGFWQFIPSTGQRYGLSQNRWVDERMHPIKATRAAAQYLKFLHDRFDSWPLALAAYNAGEGRVDRAIDYNKRRNLPTDYWHLPLPRETKRYVPAFMAMVIIAKEPQKYDLPAIEPLDSFPNSEIMVSTDFSIKEIAVRSGMKYQDLMELNPYYKMAVPPMNQKSYTLIMPEANQPKLQASLQEDPKPSTQWKMLVANSNKSRAMTNLLQKYGEVTYFSVRSGDNLWNLARKHHTTVGRLLTWNNLNKNSIIRPRQRLKLYRPTWQVFVKLDEMVNKYKTQKRALAQRVITVKPGETLSELALRHRTSVKNLMAWNNLSSPTALKAYQKLVIHPYGSQS